MSSAVSIGEFLEDRVWPELDAADCGLLEELRPQPNGKSYKLNCPSCGKRRAYYYPAKAIKCNRIESCGYSSSIWNYLIEYQGLQKRDVVKKVCQAVGVEPPDNRNGEKPSKAVSVDSRVIKILRSAFPECLHSLKERWGYTDADLDMLKRYCGFYPSVDFLKSNIPSEMHSEAERLGWFKSSLQNRLFSFWRQPSGSYGYWARAIDSAEPKYLFRPGMSKNLPYLSAEASAGLPIIGVEGGRDVLALKLMGYKNVVGVGGSFFMLPQCRFLAQTHNRIIHVLDGDIAGLKGLIKTLENGAEFGLTFEFVLIPPGSDKDPDDYRRENDQSGFDALFQNRLSAGAALAIAYAKLSADGKAEDILGKILSTRTLLSPAEQSVFTHTLAQMGIALDVRQEAIQDLSRLLNHFSYDEANSIIAKRYGLSLEIIRSGEDG